MALHWIERWPLVELEPDDEDDGDDGVADERKLFGVCPVAAYLLHHLLECMSDDWTEDGAGVLTRDELPPTLGFWLLDDEFTQAMAESCLRISSRLATGRQEVTTTCTADEINLAIASRLAIDTGYEFFIDDAVLEALLDATGPIDIRYEIDIARELLTQDSDVDHLWNPALDGIENDDDLLDAHGIAHLHPSKWFIPF